LSCFEVLTAGPDGKTFTAASYLSYLRRSNQHWWEDNGAESSCPWVFRGQPDSSYELIPSAFRAPEINALRPLVERVKHHEIFNSGWFEEFTEKKRQSCYYFCAFYFAIKQFYEFALELGLTDEIISLDDPYGMAGFDLEADGMNHYREICAHSIVALAQHHRIPTPLLDWTKKPEIAAHFAISTPIKEAHRDIAIYALRIGSHWNSRSRHPKKILSCHQRDRDGKKIQMPLNLLVDAPAKNSFLAAQHGIFTLPHDLSDFFNLGECSSLENDIAMLDGGRMNTILRKIVLPSSEVPELRRMLDRENFTEAHLMPTADRVADLVKSRWSLPD